MTHYQKWGRIDIVISNAGSLVYGSVEDCQSKDFENQIKTNYLGAVYLTKKVLPLMQKQGTGSLVYVSSISGRIYLPNNSAYQSSKAALRAFVITLRRELSNTGIKVSLVSPGRTRTKIVDNAVIRTKSNGQSILGEMPIERVASIIMKSSKKSRREIILPFALKMLLLTYILFPDFVEVWLPWIQVKWKNIQQIIKSRNKY